MPGREIEFGESLDPLVDLVETAEADNSIERIVVAPTATSNVSPSRSGLPRVEIEPHYRRPIDDRSLVYLYHTESVPLAGRLGWLPGWTIVTDEAKLVVLHAPANAGSRELAEVAFKALAGVCPPGVERWIART